MLARLLFLMLCLAATPAQATSSIDTTQPVQGRPYDASPIRQNFNDAANDINSLQRLNAGASAPSSPGLGTFWLNTSNATYYVLSVYNPANTSWLPIARLNPSTGEWIPPIGGGTLPSIVSAATTNLGSYPQGAVYVTGSQSIASFGSSVPAGQFKYIVFTGAPTLIYNATFMILPGATNMVITPGQSIIALSLGGGAWRVGFGSTAAGTVTSVTFTGDGTVLSSTPSAAVTTSGTLTATLAVHAAHTVLAGPTSGGAVVPTFRQLSCSDLSDALSGCSSAAVTGTVTSVGLSVPATSIFGVTGSPVTTTGTLGLTTTGTSGGIPYFSSTTQLATSALLTANAPVIGGGAGVAPSVGSRSGNTTVFATTSGSFTSGNTVKSDASGNLVDGGNPPSLQRLAIGWPAQIDPADNVIATVDQASTLISLVGTVAVPVGATATMSVYKSGSSTACSGGTVLHSGTFNANGTAQTNQTLTLTNTGLAAGDRICLVTTNSANWIAGAGIGGVTARVTTP